MASSQPIQDTDEIRVPFRLGDWVVDPVLKQIAREGETVRIDPRNMRVLLLLAARAGQVVPQREIEDIAWRGLVVTSDSIYQSIAQLRRALGETKSQRYIDTVARRGYRLLVPVAFDATASDPVSGDQAEITAPAELVAAPPATRDRARRGIRLAAIVVLSAGALASIAWISAGRDGSATTQSASVTPAPAASPSFNTALKTAEDLPRSYQGANPYRRSIKRLNGVIESLVATVGENDLSLVPTLMQLGNLYPLVSDPASCEQTTRRGLAILQQHGKEASPEGVELNATLAEALVDMERYDEAERHLRHATALARQVHGDQHYATIGAINQLALMRISQGRYDEAAVQARAAIAAYQHVPDRANTRNAFLVSTLTWALLEQNRLQEAIEEGRRALAAITREDPPAPYLVAYGHHFLAESLLKAGELSEAEALLRRELELLASIPHCEMDTARAESALAETLMHQGRLQEAQSSLDRATTILSSGDGWRERKSRRETQARQQQLQAAMSHAQLPRST